MSDPSRQLPPESEYWDALAERINEDAAEPLAAYAAGQQAWHAVLSRQAPWLVGSSVAAMLVLWLALPPDLPTERIEALVAPTEVAGVLLGGPVPPTVDQLMVQFPPADGRPQR